MALEATFKQTAESFSKEINQTLTNDDLKEVYGLYKQVLNQAKKMIKDNYLWRSDSVKIKCQT